PLGIVLDAETWQEADWPKNLQETLSLFPETTLFAVRSSAAGEDAQTESFAGVFKSVLKQERENVEEAVRLVHAHAKQIAHKQPLAIIVQVWVEGRFSGVSFSRHPTRGYSDCVVTDVGLGSAKSIVDGSGLPQRSFSFSRDAHLMPEQPILSHELLVQLTEKIRTIENGFKTPVDVEWTNDQDFVFLQARPMTRIPQENMLDAEEARCMQRFCSHRDLSLIKNELDETVPYPSRASFDLLCFFFREHGAYHQASTDLDLSYDAVCAAQYLHTVLGSLYIDPASSPFKKTYGLFSAWKTAWNLQKALRTIPFEFYQSESIFPSHEGTPIELLHELERAIGKTYAKISILARVAMQGAGVLGLNLDAIWSARAAWLEKQPPLVPTVDLELSLGHEWRKRMTWSKPRRAEDLYAVLREDAKDQLRYWLAVLGELIRINHAPSDFLAFDYPLIGTGDERERSEACRWHYLRKAAPHQAIAVPFTWKDLWDIRSSGLDATTEKERGVGVSDGIGTGVCVHPESPQDDIVGDHVIVVLEALTPEWFQMFQKKIAGVITEKGGLMSHGAIQCRERNIPAVFGMREARQLLPPGTHVTIDGQRGSVQRSS
nr:hypothetical protein [Patescibacteria group bacterium]